MIRDAEYRGGAGLAIRAGPNGYAGALSVPWCRTRRGYMVELARVDSEELVALLPYVVKPTHAQRDLFSELYYLLRRARSTARTIDSQTDQLEYELTVERILCYVVDRHRAGDIKAAPYSAVIAFIHAC